MMIRATVILWLFLLIFLPGCSRPESDSIRFGLASAAKNLDPRYATDATSARINRLLYRRLVDFDRHATPVPSLATWEQLTPVRYRFHLGAEGREFHGGGRLKAVDVKATYESILNDTPVSPHRALLEIVTRIETPDENTIDFHLSRPDPLFPGYLVIGIVPAQAVLAGRALADRPVGSGDFRFLERPDPQHIKLMRLRDGQVFEFLRVADPTVRVLKLVRGEIDIVQNDLPTELVGWLAEQEQLQLLRADGSNFTYLGFNLDDPVTGQRRIRQAIAHAIDREVLIRYVLGGAARPAGSLLPPEHWAGHPSLTGYAFDPARARSLVRESGEQGLTISYKTSTDPVRVRLATAIQQQLGEVGIDVRVQSYDWGTFYGDIKRGRFQMFSLSWVGIKTPDIFRYVFHSESIPPRGANRGHFRDGEVDRLLDLVAQTPDREGQARLYRQLQQRLHEQLPYVPLWYEDHVAALRRDIAGYRLASDGNYDGLHDVYRTTGMQQRKQSWR